MIPKRARQTEREKREAYELATVRDQDTCVFRSWDCSGPVQRDHRQPRDAYNTVASNLNCLCLKHHAWKHANSEEAEELGYTVPMNIRPDQYPVRRWRSNNGVTLTPGWVLLDDAGGMTWISPREASERIGLLYPGMRWNEREAS